MRPSRPTPPAVPAPLSVQQALRASDPLRELGRRMAASRDCLECVKVAIPPSLRGVVQAGPVDESGWTLLVQNAAAAAKLRQLKPHLDLLLAERMGAGIALRIKVLTQS
ncbi:hypothetical protein [Inhella gelatinilytica]|uniref:DUF721 domain-containing protein n=1 Tax=Inhella gelatinilytica TaxID=2795030 RepID=A0A931IUY6_9BURK|nr:hypothetical protein [Inhella gelatinilytica]MBH9553252.1 hypothetical protein [Inhella gelatinilytica]